MDGKAQGASKKVKPSPCPPFCSCKAIGGLMPRNITFRTHLAGSVNDFCEASGMQPLVRPNTLAELIVTLARYKEEGLRLTPEIYLCTDVEQVLHLIPEHEIVYIGNTTLSEDFIGKVLKRCATLAIDGWCIFVEGKGENIRFGVFRDSGSPLSVPIAETLLSSGDGRYKARAGLSNRGRLCGNKESYRRNVQRFSIPQERK